MSLRRSVFLAFLVSVCPVLILGGMDNPNSRDLSNTTFISTELRSPEELRKMIEFLILNAEVPDRLRALIQLKNEKKQAGFNSPWRTLSWDDVPSDFPNALILEESVDKLTQRPLQELAGRLYEFSRWHSEPQEIPGVSNRVKDFSYQERRPYYPKFNFYWNKLWIATKLKAMLDPHNQGSGHLPGKLSAHRMRLLAGVGSGEPEEHLNLKRPDFMMSKKLRALTEFRQVSSGEILNAAAILIEIPQWRGFFSSYQFTSLYDLETSLRDHLQRSAGMEKISKLGADGELSNLEALLCPPGSSLSDVKRILGGVLDNLDDMARHSNFKTQKMPRLSRSKSALYNEIHPDIELFVRLLNSGRVELFNLLYRDANLLAAHMKPGIEFGKAELEEHLWRSDQLEAATEEVRAALKKLIEENPTRFITMRDGMRISDNAPDKERYYLLAQALDSLRQFEDPYYKQFQTMRRYWWDLQRARSGEDPSYSIDYFGKTGLVHPEGKRFLLDVGILSPLKNGQVNLPVEVSLEKDFPPLVSQHDSFACASFGIAADMSAVLKKKTGTNYIVDPWLTHGIAKAIEIQNLGRNGNYTESSSQYAHRGLHLADTRPLFKMNLPDNLSDHFTSRDFFGSGAIPTDLMRIFSEVPTAAYINDEFLSMDELFGEHGTFMNFPDSLNEIKERRFRIKKFTALTPHDFSPNNPLGLDEGFLRILANHGQTPMLAVSTDASIVEGGWMKLIPNPSMSNYGIGGHLVNLAGYGTELDPFTFHVSPYFLIRDSKAGEGKRYLKVSAANLMEYLVGVYKVVDVEILDSSPVSEKKIVKE